MDVDRRLKTVFGTISELYDKSRVNYPTKLIDDVLTTSKIKENGNILDVGCGSGQATIPFARKGFNIIGLDLSQDLIEIAKKKCSTLPKASFSISSFEESSFSEKSFDLIISGQAWHWVDQEIGLKKAHDLLTDTGILAIFWSWQDREKSSFSREVGKILDTYGENRSAVKYGWLVKYSASFYNKIKENVLFNSIEKKEYFVNIEFSKERYLNLILSFSWVQKLPEKTRMKLLKDLQKLSNEYKEPLIVPYVYVLILAKKN